VDSQEQKPTNREKARKMESDKEIVSEEEASETVEPESQGEESQGEGGEAEEDQTEEGGEEVEEELWQKEDVEEAQQVPLSALMKQKKKLKGQIGERDAELERLRAEVEELKNSKTPQTLKRPRVADFDDDEEYETALDEYEEKKATTNYTSYESVKDKERQQQKNRDALDLAVTEHYERADKLVTDNGIKPEIYQKADTNVRQAIEAVLPRAGDAVANHLIATMGEGSEKAVYYLGRNKVALQKLKAKLQEDPSGIKAAMYLGRIDGKLKGQTNQNSRAPKPAANLKGDEQVTGNLSNLQRKYKKAHAEGKGQVAFNLKRQAKKGGADVTKW
jgi:hypothetical protein